MSAHRGLKSYRERTDTRLLTLSANDSERAGESLAIRALISRRSIRPRDFREMNAA